MNGGGNEHDDDWIVHARQVRLICEEGNERGHALNTSR